MAVFSNVTTMPSATTEDDRPKAEFFANIGTPSKDKAGNDTSITIPVGVALDTQKARKVTGQNQEYIDSVNAGNKLWQNLLWECQDLEPGEEKVTNLKVFIRRVKTSLEASPSEENPHAAAVNNLKLFG